MKRLLELLKDGNSRTIEQLAAELGTTTDDVARQLDFLEHIGAIRKVSFSAQKSCVGSCTSTTSCTGCDPAHCKGCMPQNAAMNMGEMWEVVR